jgi:broad specificity phosphatase PhoE
LGLGIHTADALREFDCGIMEGCGDEAAWRAHHAVSEAWVAGAADQRIEGGESLHDMRTRFVPFVQQVIRQFQSAEGEIVLITHGGLLYQMLPLVVANVDHAFVRQHSLANCACVFVELQGDQLVCVALAPNPFMVSTVTIQP